jgi:hypothetical protein
LDAGNKEAPQAQLSGVQKAPRHEVAGSCTGTYRIKGDRWITKVDVAWNPEWVGTEQARDFKIDGDRLRVLTPWRVMPNWPEKGMQRSIVAFERYQ